MLELVLVLISVGAFVFLAVLMTYGKLRRWRMRRFVEEHGGEWVRHDDFDLQPVVDALYGPGVWWVGVSARLDDAAGDSTASPTYLFDLHADLDGSPTRTAVLQSEIEAGEAPTSSCTIREAVPNSNESGRTARFEVQGDESLTDDFLSRLRANSRNRDWLLEAHFAGRTLLVSSRTRALETSEDWRELLNTAERLPPVLEPVVHSGPSQEQC